MATDKPATGQAASKATAENIEYQGEAFVISCEGNEISITGQDGATGEVDIIVRSPSGVQIFKHCVWDGNVFVCTSYSATSDDH